MISIVVCTRNRANLIEDCLDSLLNQRTIFEYEIIVVDNSSNDGTFGILNTYQKKSKNVVVVVEKKIGLSYARNTGFKKAKYNWVAYVDDDAKAHQNFVEVACQTIEEGEFDCFGGIYNGWFKYGKPSWLPERFGSNRDRMPDQQCVLNKKCFSGGVAVYRKELLVEVGGFPVDMGMKGDEVDYGEENYVQDKARELGYKVGFVPALQIDHLVRKEKLQKSWHFKDAYQKGIAKARLQTDRQINTHILKYGLLEILKYPIRTLRHGTTFYGNRNLVYYAGYFRELFRKT